MEITDSTILKSNRGARMITTKQINEIRKLHKEGKKPREISKELNLSRETIYYYSNEETRKKRIQQSVDSFKRKTLEERKKIYKRRLPYLREYQRRRYNEDIDFKTNKQKTSREYYKNNGNKNSPNNKISNN